LAAGACGGERERLEALVGLAGRGFVRPRRRFRRRAPARRLLLGLDLARQPQRGDQVGRGHRIEGGNRRAFAADAGMRHA
jgi:hypothetical protein